MKSYFFERKKNWKRMTVLHKIDYSSLRTEVKSFRFSYPRVMQTVARRTTTGTIPYRTVRPTPTCACARPFRYHTILLTAFDILVRPLQLRGRLEDTLLFFLALFSLLYVSLKTARTKTEGGSLMGPLSSIGGLTLLASTSFLSSHRLLDCFVDFLQED